MGCGDVGLNHLMDHHHHFIYQLKIA